MKKIFLIFAAGISLASCGNNSANQAQADSQRSVDSLKNEMVKQHIIDSMSAANMAQPQGAGTQEVGTTQSVEAVGTHHHSGSTSTTTTNNTTTNNTTTTAATPAQKKKKGWSAKADGAIIGAGENRVRVAVHPPRRQQAATQVHGCIIGRPSRVAALAQPGRLPACRHTRRDQLAVRSPAQRFPCRQWPALRPIRRDERAVVQQDARRC